MYEYNENGCGSTTHVCIKVEPKKSRIKKQKNSKNASFRIERVPFFFLFLILFFSFLIVDRRSIAAAAIAAIAAIASSSPRFEKRLTDASRKIIRYLLIRIHNYKYVYVVPTYLPSAYRTHTFDHRGDSGKQNRRRRHDRVARIRYVCRYFDHE